MKGYRMVLLVNAALALLLAGSAWGVGAAMESQAAACQPTDRPNGPDCQRIADVAYTAIRLVPILAAVGLLLLALGLALGREPKHDLST